MENDIDAVGLGVYKEQSAPVFVIEYSQANYRVKMDLRNLGKVDTVLFWVEDPDTAVAAYFAPSYNAIVIIKQSINCGLTILSNDSFVGRFVFFRLFVPNYMDYYEYEIKRYTDGWVESEEKSREIREVFETLSRHSLE